MIGERLGPWRVLALLGRGGMGAVYRARHEERGEEVALKVLPADAALDAQVAERFRKEAELLAGLRHANIVSVVSGLATERGHAFYGMELVPGQSLARILAQRGRLEPGETVAVALEVLAALGAAHERGVIHRDVKPGNVLLARGGAVKVVDFGLARALDATRLTLAGQALGTPAYMSPEQADARPLDARTDLYSTGVLVYELLSGKPPFQAETPLAILRQHVEAPVPPLAVAAPAGLEGVVRRALEKDPARRFASAAEFALALRSLGIASASDALALLAGTAETTTISVTSGSVSGSVSGSGSGSGSVSGSGSGSGSGSVPVPVPVPVPGARRSLLLAAISSSLVLGLVLLAAFGPSLRIFKERRRAKIELVTSETLDGIVLLIEKGEARIRLADGTEVAIPASRIRKIRYLNDR